jgi:threonine dehydrogenase-like Zn-dependent dehydrogenase
MAARIARQRGVERVIAIDGVTERLEMARRHGVETLDYNEHDDVPSALKEMTNGRGPDSVIDAVGMEAHGAPTDQMSAGADRLGALNEAIQAVRRGGTLSIIGVYGGPATPLPIITLFDKQIQVRMGQANVKHWVDEIMPLVTDDSDPLGVEDLATHKLPLTDAPRGYDIFQKKEDDSIKVLLQP